jgi:hypothetical protein
MKLQGAYEDIIDFEWNSLVSRFDGKVTLRKQL